MKKLLGVAAATAAVTCASAAHAARDYVWAAGSSTVFPFTTRVAENFSKKTGKKSPKVESLGTGGGFKMFCGGNGEGFPDVANASRPMKKSEFEACKAKGVKDIVEIKIGFDGIVVAMDKPARATMISSFELNDLYLRVWPRRSPKPERNSSSLIRLQDLERGQQEPAEPAHPGLRPAAHLGHARRLVLELGDRAPERQADSPPSQDLQRQRQDQAFESQG